MSARGAVARQQGADEQMLDKVDDYETSDLPEPQRAALQLADVYLAAPGAATDATRAEIAGQLAPTQVVEVVLKLMGFSSDKVMVTLGLDFDDMVDTFTL
jgi:alkylhydroperoxidase family enzyme